MLGKNHTKLEVETYIKDELTAVNELASSADDKATDALSNLSAANNKATDALSNSSIAAGKAANAESLSNLAMQYVQAVPVTRGDGLNSIRQAGDSSTYHPFSKGEKSVATGKLTTSLGDYSHSEGNSSNLAPEDITTDTSNDTIKTSWNSKKFSLAKGQNAHVEGNNCLALTNHTHAEGNQTVAEGQQSHTEGYLTETKNQSEHAEGRCNKSTYTNTTFGNAGNTISSIGIGSNANNRKNAFEVMQNGDIYILGIGGYDGTNAGQSGVKTLQYVLLNQ